MLHRLLHPKCLLEGIDPTGGRGIVRCAILVLEAWYPYYYCSRGTETPWKQAPFGRNARLPSGILPSLGRKPGPAGAKHKKKNKECISLECIW